MKFRFKGKKLLNPCKNILYIFKFRFKKPLLVKSLPFRRQKTTTPKSKETTFFKGLPRVLGSLRRSREMDRVMELKSFSSDIAASAGHHKAGPCPSPLTLAYVTLKTSGAGQEDVEDACRSFENYLVEMIVEEGKIKDLMDVENYYIAGRTLNVLFLLIWFVDFMGSYARTCSPTINTL